MMTRWCQACRWVYRDEMRLFLWCPVEAWFEALASAHMPTCGTWVSSCFQFPHVSLSCPDLCVLFHFICVMSFTMPLTACMAAAAVLRLFAAVDLA